MGAAIVVVVVVSNRSGVQGYFRSDIAAEIFLMIVIIAFDVAVPTRAVTFIWRRTIWTLIF